VSEDPSSPIRQSYDRIAEEYARRIFDELQHKPLDRQLLDRFAAQVRPGGRVCDMGCGPGHIARYLHEAGCPCFGLDLSPETLKQARRLSPDLEFCEGNMFALNLADHTLAGIAALYAIVNIAKEELPLVFSEMVRVLEPGGLLLLAFHSGEEALHESELWGYAIDMDFFFFRPVEIHALLERAGFVVEEIVERDPYPEVEYPSHRAYVFARKTLGPRSD